MRENKAAVQDNLSALQILLSQVSELKVLDPELGEEELIESVAAELANLDSGYT